MIYSTYYETSQKHQRQWGAKVKKQISFTSLGGSRFNTQIEMDEIKQRTTLTIKDGQYIFGKTTKPLGEREKCNANKQHVSVCDSGRR